MAEKGYRPKQSGRGAVKRGGVWVYTKDAKGKTLAKPVNAAVSDARKGMSGAVKAVTTSSTSASATKSMKARIKAGVSEAEFKRRAKKLKGIPRRMAPSRRNLDAQATSAVEKIEAKRKKQIANLWRLTDAHGFMKTAEGKKLHHDAQAAINRKFDLRVMEAHAASKARAARNSK